MITIMNTGAIYTDSTASVESCKLNLSGCWMRRCSLQRLLAFRRVASCCHVVDQKGRQRCTEEDSNNTGDLGDALLVILPGEDSCSYRHACKEIVTVRSMSQVAREFTLASRQVMQQACCRAQY